MSVELRVRLTNAEAAAVLRSEGFSNGRGIKKSVALQTAQMKIIGGIASGVPVSQGKDGGNE